MKKIRAWLSQRWPILLLALLLALPLMVALRDVVRDTIVYPLARFFWLARLVFMSIPPVFIWGYFLLIALRIALHSLRSAPKQARISKPEPSHRQSRVAQWARRIRLTSRGDYSLWRLAHYLGTLAVDVVAADERIDISESRRRMQQGEWEAPEEVRDYFRAATHPAPFERHGCFFTRIWRRFLRRRPPPASLDVDLHSVVTFLEGRLGIDAPKREAE